MNNSIKPHPKCDRSEQFRSFYPYFTIDTVSFTTWAGCRPADAAKLYKILLFPENLPNGDIIVEWRKLHLDDNEKQRRFADKYNCFIDSYNSKLICTV